MGVIETVKQNKNKKGKSTLKLLHSSDIYISCNGIIVIIAFDQYLYFLMFVSQMEKVRILHTPLP